MKNLLTLLALGGTGWFLWESVTKEMWIELAKWVGTGVVVVIVLTIMIRVIRDKAEEREADRQMAKVNKVRPMVRQDHQQSPMHPQVMYIPQSAPYPQQPTQAPAGLVDLALDKYEWEI